MKDRSIEGLANVVMLPKNNSPHMTEWDNENNGGHDRARSQNKEKRQVKEEQEIKILKSKSKKSKTQKVPTIRPRTTVKNNPQVANISGTFKPPPRVTGRKDHRDVNESKLQKRENKDKSQQSETEKPTSKKARAKMQKQKCNKRECARVRGKGAKARGRKDAKRVGAGREMRGAERMEDSLHLNFKLQTPNYKLRTSTSGSKNQYILAGVLTRVWPWEDQSHFRARGVWQCRQ